MAAPAVDADTVDTTIRIIHAVVSLAIVPGVHYLRGIRQQLVTMNEEIIRNEQWRLAHDKQDDERHEDVSKRLHVVERRIDRFPHAS